MKTLKNWLKISLFLSVLMFAGAVSSAAEQSIAKKTAVGGKKTANITSDIGGTGERAEAENAQVSTPKTEKLNLPKSEVFANLFQSKWTCLQLGLSSNYSLFSTECAIYGLSFQLFSGVTNNGEGGIQIAVGQLVNGGDFTGINFAMLNIVHARMAGLQLGLMNYATENLGMQAGLTNVAFRQNYCQIGVLNIARQGLQIGVLNSNINSYIPVMIGINFSR